MADDRTTRVTAFPTLEVFDSPGATIRKSKGMTLRDYFAGQVILGLVTNSEINNGELSPRELAYDAYLFADAMMGARDAK